MQSYKYFSDIHINCYTYMKSSSWIFLIWLKNSFENSLKLNSIVMLTVILPIKNNVFNKDYRTKSYVRAPITFTRFSFILLNVHYSYLKILENFIFICAWSKVFFHLSVLYVKRHSIEGFSSIPVLLRIQ